ncbi:MAG TPA: thiolase family protein [Acidimicrobiia bacterium]|jgi:acetyl-CoA acetyltransferase
MVSIVGAGTTHFGRHPDGDMRSLAEAATRAALDDAGLSPADVQMVVFGNAVDGVLHGQEMVRGEVALRHAGFRGVPILNVENACASSSSAFHVACLAVRAGAADVALVVGVEKLTHPQKERSFAAVATATDLVAEPELRRAVAAILLGAEGSSGVPVDRSPLMDRYAGKARRYMDRAGATVEDFARVSEKNRWHGSFNPHAQFRTPVTSLEVLASRMVADPLRLLMCAPVGDGAAALVVASDTYVRRRGRGAVGVAACAVASGGSNPEARAPAERAARAAYEQAGLGPLDVDVAEVHDACAPAELWIYEELGLCAPGEAAKLLRDGATHLGGRIPVNPSGGLLSKGHPLGATGCGQLVELTEQLRGRAGGRQVSGARVGLAHNCGGLIDGEEAVAVVTILSAPPAPRARRR